MERESFLWEVVHYTFFSSVFHRYFACDGNCLPSQDGYAVAAYVKILCSQSRTKPVFLLRVARGLGTGRELEQLVVCEIIETGRLLR